MYRKALTSDSLSTHGFFFPSPPLASSRPPPTTSRLSTRHWRWPARSSGFTRCPSPTADDKPNSHLTLAPTPPRRRALTNPTPKPLPGGGTATVLLSLSRTCRHLARPRPPAPEADSLGVSSEEGCALLMKGLQGPGQRRLHMRGVRMCVPVRCF